MSQEQAASARQIVAREVAVSIGVSGVLPFVFFSLASGHMSEFWALVVSAVPPTIYSIVDLLYRRRLDPIGVVALVGILLSLFVMLLGGGARWLLVRESLVTGIMGLGFAGSVLLPRPVIFYLGRQFTCGEDPQKIAAWNARWEAPRFRRILRLMSVVWGCGLALEAIIRIGLALTIAIPAFLLVSPFVQYGFLAALGGWTVWYTRRMRRAPAPVAPAPAEATAQ